MNLTLDLKACGQDPHLGKAVAVAILSLLPPHVAEEAVAQWRTSSARSEKIAEIDRQSRTERLKTRLRVEPPDGSALRYIHMTTVAEIQRAVAEHYDVSVEQILSPRRAAPIVWPRHVAMYLAREITGQSFPSLAQEFNRDDHSTIIYATRRVTARIHGEETAARDIEQLRSRLESP